VTGDWRTVPGNKAAYERLRDLLKQGDAIAFVGAGASAGLYPLWGGLIGKLIGTAVSHGRADAATAESWRGNLANYPDQVVRGIKGVLDNGTYAEAMRQIFRPQVDAEGNRFTPTHGALLRLPFKGCITTNYDSGLIEARARMRPDCPQTGYATWKDADAVAGWDSGDVFPQHPRPILFAHGIYERTESIVLGTAEYREVYKPGAFRRMFDGLRSRGHMVFVGFSFADAWVRFLANDVLTAAGTRTAAPRHVAVIGLPPGHAYAPFDRDLFVNQYDAEPLFYPIRPLLGGGEDHGALVELLSALAGEMGIPEPREPAIIAAPSASVAKPMPRRWAHETTNDEKFTARMEPLQKLHR
jgi:hypothetical protein